MRKLSRSSPHLHKHVVMQVKFVYISYAQFAGSLEPLRKLGKDSEKRECAS